MDLTVFILCLFGLQVICLIIGNNSSKGLKTQEDYFLAGKGIRFFPLMMTFLATQVGGGFILGAAEEAYQSGWSVLFYPLGATLGMILLGMGIGRRLAKFQVSTVAQIFEVAYGSALLKKIASLLSIVSLFAVLVAQVMASSKFMSSVGLESPVAFVLFWAMVIFYTAIGGLKAVVATDVIQATFFMVVFFFSLGMAVYNFSNPTLELFAFNFVKESSIDSLKLCGWLLMPLLFMTFEQDMGQRCFAAGSPKILSKAAIWAAISFLMLSIIPIFFGILAKKLGVEVPIKGSILMAVVQRTTSPACAALVGCAILAAILSTADSLINSISSNLAQDFHLSWLKAGGIRASQIVSTSIALGAVACSFCFDNVLSLLIQSYELAVSCLFIPVFIALFKRVGNPLSAALSIGFGFCGFVLFRTLPFELPKEICSILLSLIGYYAGIWILKKETIQAASYE